MRLRLSQVSDTASRRPDRPGKRGDSITIALPGDLGTPRPGLTIQTNQFEGTATVTILLVSSTFVQAPLLRVTVQPGSENGLQKPSQVMIDKIMTLKRDKLGRAFGHIGPEVLLEIERGLAVFLGIAT